MNKKLTLAVFFCIALVSLPIKAEAATYDFYVDKDNDTGTEDGSNTSPYNTITEAIEAAMKNDAAHRKIYVSEGTYSESIMLEENVKLYGKNDQETIIDGELNSYTVKMKDRSLIQDVMIFRGERGIVVTENSKSSIQNVRVKESVRIGIELQKSTGSSNGKVTIKNTKVFKGKGKGMYLQKGKVDITNSKVYDNKEEGIDIRAGVNGKIKNNEIRNNGESGIEALANKASLLITRNNIKNNKSSAVTVQYYKDSGKGGLVKIKNNKISKNSEYAVNCATPSGGSPGKKYWGKSIILIDNVIGKNKRGEVYSRCLSKK